jgi:hypothetical protein
MAAFRYKLQIIPRSFLGNEPLTVVSEDALQDGIEPWSAALQPSQTCLKRLRELLPKKTSWGNTEEYVSNGEWTSKLCIWHGDDGMVQSIDFGYSAFSGDWQLMREFASIVQAEDYLLIEGKSGLVMPPDEETLKSHFLASNAGRFLVDPEDAMRRASENIRLPRTIGDEDA